MAIGKRQIVGVLPDVTDQQRPQTPKGQVLVFLSLKDEQLSAERLKFLRYEPEQPSQLYARRHLVTLG